MTVKRFKVCDYPTGRVLEDIVNHKELDDIDYVCELLNELHDEKQSVIDWIDRKIEEIKPYNSELCRATLLELKEFLE